MAKRWFKAATSVSLINLTTLSPKQVGPRPLNHSELLTRGIYSSILKDTSENYDTLIFKVLSPPKETSYNFLH
jgi:hypothetical protein